jgi:hypothetical protein
MQKRFNSRLRCGFADRDLSGYRVVRRVDYFQAGTAFCVVRGHRKQRLARGAYSLLEHLNGFL